MSSIPRGARLCRETVRAAREFHLRALWHEYDNEHVFLVRIPGEEHPLAVSIMGAGGEQFGLNCLRGERAYVDHFRMMEGPQDDETSDSLSILAFSMDPLRSIPPDYRRFLDKAGVQARRDALVPCFLAKEAGRFAREINQTEALAILFCIRGTLEAFDRGLLTPGRLGKARDVLVLTVSGHPLHPDVIAGTEPAPALPRRTASPTAGLPCDELASLPLIPTEWIVGLPRLNASVQDDDRSMRTLLVIDGGSGVILASEVVMGIDVETAIFAFSNLVQTGGAQGEPGLPEDVVFASRILLDSLAPELSAAGVRCSYDPHPPILERVVAGLDAHLDEVARTELTDDSIPISGRPDPVDLPGWQEAHHEVIRHLVGRVARRRLMKPRSLTRYFGSEDFAEEMIEDRPEFCAVGAYMEWLLTDYRATRRSLTIAEQVLEENPPEIVETLLRARIDSPPALYRLEGIRAGDSVHLVDILTGHGIEVHDVPLADHGTLGMILPARVIPVGVYRFIAYLGPALMPGEIDRALAFLEDEGLTLDPEGLSAAPHLLGRLWAWIVEAHDNPAPLRMTNTDGDDLELLTASFEMTDEPAVRRALEARDDIDFDPRDESYSWLRDGVAQGMAGDVTLLGRIQLIGREIILDINSTNRLETARGWLERIPGVRYVGRTTHDWREALPRDDQSGPGETFEPPPEAAEALRSMLHDRHMQWLDTPLPMYGGKTPREMCRTGKGKRRVAATIRAMAEPAGPLGSDIVRVPREEMLRELGLE